MKNDKRCYSVPQKAIAMRMLKDAVRVGKKLNAAGPNGPYQVVSEIHSSLRSIGGQLVLWAPCILEMIEAGEKRKAKRA